MRTPEERREMMRQQVIPKVRWGARQQEVLDWLQEKHHLVGPEADQLLAEANRARHKRIRENALMRLGFSIIGLVFVSLFFFTRFGFGIIIYGGVSTVLMTIFAGGLGWVSFKTFVQSLAQLLTGETTGPAD